MTTQTPYGVASEKLGAVSMADVKPESVKWLWHPRIPLGKLTLIDGDPGLGKSFITAAISSAVSTGRALPGEQSANPARVLLMSAEDGLADTVRPRLDALGADCSMITALSKRVTLDHAGCVEVHNLLEVEKPKVVIIDPLFAYTGAKVDIHKANETRDVMTRLSRLAEHHECAILCVRHLTKSGRDKSIYRGIGSIDLTAACRSVLLVGADVNDRSRRAIVQIKNNLAPLADPIGYSLDEGRFTWTGVSDLTADQILASEETAAESFPIEEAVEFLTVLLSSGPTNQKDVKTAAQKAGISEKTLYRAKKKLNVHSYRSGFGGDGSWVWSRNARG